MKSFQTTRITTFTLAIVFHVVASATPIIGKVTDAGTGEAIIGATIYDPRAHQDGDNAAVQFFQKGRNIYMNLSFELSPS